MGKVPMINISEHLEMGDGITVAVQDRFAMPAVVVAALRQAAKGAVLKLLTLMEDEKKFKKLTPEQQLKVIELVLNRAYGKSETATSSLNLLHRAGQLEGNIDSGMGGHLKEIETRMNERSVTYPEMRSKPLHHPDATAQPSLAKVVGYNPTKTQEIILPDVVTSTVVDLEERIKNSKFNHCKSNRQKKAS